MTTVEFVSSESESDEFDWSSKRRRKFENYQFVKENSIKNESSLHHLISQKQQKFEDLQKKIQNVRIISARQSERTEKRRAKRLIKKALRDPFIKKAVTENEVLMSDISNSVIQTEKKEEEEWNDIKTFLNVNEHMQGPISHGEWGPKTEMESIIDDVLKDGDFQKAELLSDTLANKKFAQKICKAFAAKRSYEKLEEQKAMEKAQKMKKVRWTFGAKERWQMKGNM